MIEWIEWARGPIFRASLAIMLIGLLRLLLLNLYSIVLLVREARKNGREVPFQAIVRVTFEWLFPIRKVREQRFFFSIVSIMFHTTIIVTPIFLGTHIVLWQRGLGISWPALPVLVADIFTIVAIITGLILFFDRIYIAASRGLSRFQDYFIPLLIIVPFLSGFFIMHPTINVFGYNSMLFIHIMSANLLFVIIPFSKISHVALFPLSQLISELGWFLEPSSGAKVARALGKENEAV